MGWRDRDYGKFTADEWAEIVHTSPTPSGHRTTSITLVAGLLTALAIVAGTVVHLRPSTPHPRTPSTTNAVSINWEPASLVAATTPGRICVTTPGYGQICSAYAVGQRPADMLTQAMAARGLSVVSR